MTTHYSSGVVLGVGKIRKIAGKMLSNGERFLLLNNLLPSSWNRIAEMFSRGERVRANGAH